MTLVLTAPCPTHGIQEFHHFDRYDLWVCPGMFPGLGNALDQHCWSVVLDEDIARNPDGGDVRDLREVQDGAAVTLGIGGRTRPTPPDRPAPLPNPVVPSP